MLYEVITPVPSGITNGVLLVYVLQVVETTYPTAKSSALTLKKILLLALTINLQKGAAVAGIVTTSEPSLGVFANNVVQVVPPSVVIKISTFRNNFV